MCSVLGLSGSLRRASLNSALLRLTARLVPPGCTVHLYESLGALPLFNPDLEATPPLAVTKLRLAVDEADALLIASPEYAHGVSGPMKNALDWLVSHEGFVGKPVALFNASPRAHHAYDALLETLTTMSARIVREACATVPLLGSGLAEHALAGEPTIADPVRVAMEGLHRAVHHGGAAGPNFAL